MKLKLACADFCLSPALPHDRVLDLIAMLEFDGVDIGLFEGRSHLHPSQVFKAPAKSGAALGRQAGWPQPALRRCFSPDGPELCSLRCQSSGSRPPTQARDWFLKTLDYAAAAKSKHVTALPGVYFDDEKPSASWDRCCTELAWRVDQARKHRLVFSIEAHIGSIVPKPKEALRLVRAVPGLTLTLDYTHFTRLWPARQRRRTADRACLTTSTPGARAKAACKPPSSTNTIDYAASCG